MTRYPADADRSRHALLVLAHGAGAGEKHPFMVTIARGLAGQGIDVVTFNFPYMDQKRRVPDKAPVLEASFRGAVDEARAGHDANARLFIGGKSMGGRMATHLAAVGLAGLHGVVLLGYPLHPPGKPEQRRAAHLPRIPVPVLIVQGERDSFGTPAELESAFAPLGKLATLHVVEHGDHSLAVSRSGGVRQNQVYDTVIARIASWIDGGAAV